MIMGDKGSKNIKIAVQFFGHLRTFKECASSVKRYLLEKYDCDVFMHTWSKTEHSTQTWHNSKCDSVDVDDNIIKTVQDLYSPKSLNVEEQIDVKDNSLVFCQHNNGKNSISIQGIKYMIYSKWKVNELRREYESKKSIAYDYVIMIRPDVRLNKDFLIDDLVRESECLGLKEGRFCALNISGNTDFPIIGSTASDVLYLAKPKVMDRIVNVLSTIDFEKVNRDSFWNPETFFIKILQENNVESYFIDYCYGKAWEILRPSKKSLKDYLSIRISRNKILISILGCLQYNVVCIHFSAIDRLEFLFKVGNYSCSIKK